MTGKKKSFALLGASRTGIALACHLKKAGYAPVFLWNRSQEGIDRAGIYIHFQQRTTDLATIPQNIDWIIIAVTDDSIETVAWDLSNVLKEGKGKKVFHISGAWDSDRLVDLETKNYRTGSFHPLLSVPDIDTGISMMGNAVFSCEGDIADELQQLAKKIGGTGIILNSEQKSLVHLSAVFVNNFQTVTIEALKQLAESQDIPPSRLAQLLQTVSRQAVENAWKKSLGNSLTGPVVRGDQKTIKKHLDQLQDWPELKILYEHYIELTRQLMQKELE